MGCGSCKRRYKPFWKWRARAGSGRSLDPLLRAGCCIAKDTIIAAIRREKNLRSVSAVFQALAGVVKICEPKWGLASYAPRHFGERL